MAAQAMRPQAVGWFGKLPARGDFVGRGLPPDWLRTWDDWLQRSLAQAADALGAGLLRQCLAEMPPWHCVVLPSEPAQPVWCGVVVPSADRIGRVYPLLLAEAYGSVELDAAGVVQLHERALRRHGWLRDAAAAGSPDGFEARIAVLGETGWCGEAASDAGETLAALRRACPHAASFWWCAAPTEFMVPPQAESWPPRTRLLLDWLGEGD
jgi:type VI secretion system protein ImpM